MRPIVLGLLLLFTADAIAEDTPRGWRATYLFRKHNACPSTGQFTGPCPGWRMDHMHSLRCGGPDTPENLWWLTVEEHKAKLKPEAQCWRYYKGPRP